MTAYDIPFNKPYMAGPELEYMADAVRAGHASGDGPYTRKCQDMLEDLLGVERALLTTSCTHALELSAFLLRLSSASEVIVPSFSFVSTANAFAVRGAQIVFADIRPDTLNIDERKLEAMITPATRAIVVVHYGGVACEMDPIIELGEEYNVAIVEDNAHGLLARYRDRPLGTIGDFGALSFHETKNISCGEGGALLVNDRGYVDRAEIMHDKGTNRQKFYRGDVDKYTWVDLGSSYSPSDILAAYLYAQLEHRETIRELRQRCWTYYDDHLHEWADVNDVSRQLVPSYCEPSHHVYPLIMPDADARDGLIEHLKSNGILAVFHYQPLNASHMGFRSGSRHPCPVAEDVSARLLRLPLYNGMTSAEQIRVVEAVRAFSV